MSKEKEFVDWVKITADNLKEMKEQDWKNYFDEPVTITMTRRKLLALHTALDYVGQCLCEVGDAWNEMEEEV